MSKLCADSFAHRLLNGFCSIDSKRQHRHGFFITDDGYLISHYHVIKDATKVRLLTSAGLIDAKVVQVDAANDLALLKANAEGGMKNAETGQSQTTSNQDFIIHPSAFN